MSTYQIAQDTWTRVGPFDVLHSLGGSSSVEFWPGSDVLCVAGWKVRIPHPKTAQLDHCDPEIGYHATPHKGCTA